MLTEALRAQRRRQTASKTAERNTGAFGGGERRAAADHQLPDEPSLTAADPALRWAAGARRMNLCHTALIKTSSP